MPIVPMLIASILAGGTPVASAVASPAPAAPAAAASSGWQLVGVSKAGRAVIDQAGGPVRELPPDQSGDESRVVAPDGRHDLFFGSVDGAKGFDLFIADRAAGPDGAALRSNVRRVTAIDGDIRGPVWMPDSRRVLFLRGRGKETELLMVDAVAAPSDAAQPRPGVSRFGGDRRVESGAVVSRDGRVAWLVHREGEGKGRTVDLLVLDPGAAAPRVVVERAWLGAFAFSPDGRTLAVSRPGEVELIDLSTGSGRTRSLKAIHEGMCNDVSSVIAWRPDGGAIALLPYFPGGRTEGTVLYSDDKIVILPVSPDQGQPIVVAKPPWTVALEWSAADGC